MNNAWLLIISGLVTVYFGAQTLRLLPTLFRLLIALLTGVVKWPGPRIHDPDPRLSTVKVRLGVDYQSLFSTFLWNTLSVAAALVFSLLAFLGRTPLLVNDVRVGWAQELFFLIVIVFAGRVSCKWAQRNGVQVDRLLSDLASGVEPRGVDGQSAETDYAIEHPLVGHQAPMTDNARALELYYESVRCHQDGNARQASVLYQEATDLDPSLHEHACESLSNMAEGCNPKDAGPIYYWLGVHSEHRMNFAQAAASYENAIIAFGQLGYQKRESRAHCNLGHVKMRLGDPSALAEFEKAVALNPRDGIAHINIGTAYYMISERGDPEYEQALNAFADAIVVDPSTYGPIVISRLRLIGYTWREDLAEITKRVESKQP